jgi:hypothetical protein
LEVFPDLKDQLVALIVPQRHGLCEGELEPPLVALLRHKNALEMAEHAMKRALQLAMEQMEASREEGLSPHRVERGAGFARPSEGRGGIERKTLRPPHQMPEFLAADLREALSALGEIVGETTTDEILDQIFNQFCIGK